MKKLLIVMLSIILCISFVACNKDANGDESSYTETTGLEFSSTPAPSSSEQAPSSEPSSSETHTSSSQIAVSSENNVSSSTPEENNVATNVNSLRPDYDLGECKKLSGDISVLVFFANDSESNWGSNETQEFIAKEIKPGLDFLESEAARYGVRLKFWIESYPPMQYDGDVVIDVNSSGVATSDALYQMAKGLNFESDKHMYSALRQNNNRETICLTVFNKEGTAYALNPKRDSQLNIVEHCIVFSMDIGGQNNPVGSQSSIVAHEILHLFGAEDYYDTAERKQLAASVYPDDIMLAAKYYIKQNNIGDATAFYIGWTDKVPEVFSWEGWSK